MDVALSYSNQDKGFGKNIFNGGDVFLTRKFDAQSRLRFEFSDVSTLTLSGDYNQIRGTTGTAVQPAFGHNTLFVNGALRTLGSAFFPGDFDLNAGPFTPFVKSKQWGASLTFETQFSDMTFRSISAYREGREDARIDLDGGPLSIVNDNFTRDPRRSMSQEFQLLSDSSGPFEWVVGAYYFYFKTKHDPFQINAVAAYSTDVDESIAAYGQGSYEILPDTRLTLGGRYTVETRDIDGFVLINGVDQPDRRGSRSQKFKEPTWRIALDHKLNRDALVYASVSRGFNAGFFNQVSLAGFRTDAQNPTAKPRHCLPFWPIAAGGLSPRFLPAMSSLARPILVCSFCWRASQCASSLSHWRTRPRGSSGLSWCAVRSIANATCRRLPHRRKGIAAKAGYRVA